MHRITQPKEPHRLKDTEKDRINPAFVNLTAGDKFYPHEEIVYLWAYNANKELAVGIEYPWQHPEAFDLDLGNDNERAVWELISEQLQTLIEGIIKHYGFGHPTLAANFDEEGSISVHLAHLGGELKYVEGEWVIDNKSGRFGRYEEADLEIQRQIENTMLEVSDIFNNAGIPVKPKLDFENPKIDSPLLSDEARLGYLKNRLIGDMDNNATSVRNQVEASSKRTRISVEEVAEEIVNEMDKKIKKHLKF
jgi:hypothetical protein